MFGGQRQLEPLRRWERDQVVDHVVSNIKIALLQKNQVRPAIPLIVFTPRFGSWIPAQDMCKYPASKVRARLSRKNQWVPTFA